MNTNYSNSSNYSSNNSCDHLDSSTIVRRVTHLLIKGKGWLKIFGILLLISGVGAILESFVFFSESSNGTTISGTEIILGILLLKAYSAIIRTEKTESIEDIRDTFRSIGIYFVINGISLLLFCGLILLGSLAIVSLLLLQ